MSTTDTNDSPSPSSLSPSSIDHLSISSFLLPCFYNASSAQLSLPQHDETPEERNFAIQTNRDKYQWSTQVIGDSPMISGLPLSELPQLGWIAGIISVIRHILSNDSAVHCHSKREKLQKYCRLSSKIAQCFSLYHASQDDNSIDTQVFNDLFDMAEDSNVCSDDVVYSLEKYHDLYQVFKPDAVAYENQFLNDDIFGWYRVAGPSPMHIRRLTVPVSEIFPEFSNEILQGIPAFENDCLQQLHDDGRLFYVDYQEFNGVEQGALNGQLKKNFYLYAPICLLAAPKECQPRHTVLPLAIRCGQDKEKYSMHTPCTKTTDEVTWLAAKCTVQVADAVMHETRYHLGRTHLLLEAFICAMKRSLAPCHPLYKLLDVHFEGTTFINHVGSIRLAAPGGTLDQITAPSIDVTTKLCNDAIRGSFSFNNCMPDNEFKERGMMDDNLNYPFRDDAMKIWEAILQWVRVYVETYYKTDDDVTQDDELGNWCHEIVENGCVPDFGDDGSEKVYTRDYLVRFVSTLIYIASVQHAALNFTQGTHMQFVPAMPLVGFAPAPEEDKPFESVDEWVEKMLPNMEVAKKQMNTAELLAGFQWTTLGDYGREFQNAPEEVKMGIQDFKYRLCEIDHEIVQRNRRESNEKLPVYDFLRPSKVPQSTNV